VVRVLVLGGTGFVGSRVVRMLVAHDHEVSVLHRGDTEADLPMSVRHIHTSFEAVPELGEQLGRLAPDVVLDMVPDMDKGGHGVLHLRGIADRAVVITSCDVYRAFGRLWRSEPGPPDPVPLTEESPLRERPAEDGGAAGLAFDNMDVERAVSGDVGIEVTVLRLPATHGPGDPQHRLARYLRRMHDGRPAIVLADDHARWRWSRGYVENVAAAVALAVEAERAAGCVYNVGEQHAYTEMEWVRRIGDVYGWSGDVVAVPAERLPTALRLPYDFRQQYVVDTSRIRDELGYKELVSEEDGLRPTIEWELHAPESLVTDYELEDAALRAVSG
jgi:nucleoside-diphosphate-sugar epimerase